MLKKEFRLRKQKDFDRIFSEKGSFFSQGPLALKVTGNDLQFPRVGFIVSNKVSKSAVKRNRIKRLLRESIRLSWCSIMPGVDVVIIARSDISDKKKDEVAGAVDSLLKRSGLLVKK